MTKECMECGREIYGRADKRFCGDACRSAYNNKLTGGTDKLVRSVNRKLRKNREILSRLNPEGKTTLHREQLLKGGFDMEYVTNTYTTKDGRTYRFCYEQGYLELDKGFVLLVRRDPRD
ncbi:hypothetical protein [Marinoscillum furvescens]|uniref:DUF2116 family Zn-ribbon domain-containing protein n=1 Tax=Marinoscillum furvescens DSM 4134 TaxID=1122208 RepID=A0A3D9L3S2_MARFU|nr:hypothetical protein [Marinoscillum furvescens]REE00099.1 hypothetical protein C7460_10636 [Marinoscillum furvescens DSM 4134]